RSIRRISFRSASPSILGIMMSETTTSGDSDLYISTACAPSSACTGSKPSRSSRRARRERRASWSSTTSTLGLAPTLTSSGYEAAPALSSPDPPEYRTAAPFPGILRCLGNLENTKLLHHCPYRSRQVDAG